MSRRESTGGASGVAQLLRDAIAAHEKRNPNPIKKESAQRVVEPRLARESNSFRPVEAAATPAGEGPRIKVVLIDEGLGNRRNMNYYGPEAIASAAKMFEGKPSFVNHPSESEETDLPERDLGKQYGYFKGLHVEKVKNAQGKEVDACVGELHFDLTELGRRMYAKALTALHYQKEFPDSGAQYMGWSVLGGGDGDKREVDPAKDHTGTLAEFDEPVEVNYVSEFVEAESCDAVTRAGRGGRVLAIAEDANGAKESHSMKKFIEAAKAHVKSLKEAAVKAEGDIKEALLASVKNLTAKITAAEADMAAATEGDAFEAMCAPKEGEAEEAHKERLSSMAKMLAGKLAPKEDDGDGDDDEPEPKKPDAEESDRNVRAVKSYMAEAGVPVKAFPESKIKKLAALPFKEAKAAIDEAAAMVDSIREGLDLPVASLHRRTGEGAGAAAEGARGRSNNALKESFKGE